MQPLGSQITFANGSVVQFGLAGVVITAVTIDDRICFETPAGLLSTQQRNMRKAIDSVNWHQRTKAWPRMEYEPAQYDFVRYIGGPARYLFVVCRDVPAVRFPAPELSACSARVRCGRRMHTINVSPDGAIELLDHDNHEELVGESVLTGQRCRCLDVYINWQLSLVSMTSPHRLPKELRLARQKMRPTKEAK